VAVQRKLAGERALRCVAHERLEVARTPKWRRWCTEGFGRAPQLEH